MRKVSLSILLGVILACLTAGAGERKKEFIPFHRTSRLKQYNPNAVWRHEPCKRCNGTGFTVVLKHDHARNRTIKHLEPCQRCKGTGTRGMSKM